MRSTDLLAPHLVQLEHPRVFGAKVKLLLVDIRHRGPTVAIKVHSAEKIHADRSKTRARSRRQAKTTETARRQVRDVHVRRQHATVGRGRTQRIGGASDMINDSHYPKIQLDRLLL